MNRFGYRQKAMGACDGMGMESVVCPRPRRFGFLRCPINHCEDSWEAAAAQLLEDVLPEGVYDPERPPPPFFLGSPPCRASNPLVQDARFVDERLRHSFSPAPLFPSARNGEGCVQTKFGHLPATVRIKGFNRSASSTAGNSPFHIYENFGAREQRKIIEVASFT